MGGAGGRTADISVEEAARGVYRVFAQIQPAQSGSFLDWQGNAIPF